MAKGETEARPLSRRDFLRASGLGLAGAALLGSAACRGAPGAGGGDTSGALEVWIMQPGSEELERLLQEFTDDFMRGNSGIEINLQFVPWASAHDQFVTAVGGGQVPDVAEMGTTWTPEFASLGALAAFGGEVYSDSRKYVSSLVESATLDGSVYGIPWYAGARSLIYRADVLEELGLKAPATWDQLVEAGRAVQQETDMYAFSIVPASFHYFLPMVWQFGGQIARKTGDTWRSEMNSPEAIEAMRFHADLFREEKFSPNGALNWDAVDGRSAFINGTTAMMIGGGWDLSAALEAAPGLEGKVGTVLTPAGPGGSGDAFAGGSHLSVFEESENKELAWAYAEFLTRPERIAQWSDRIGFLPGTVEGIERTGYGEDSLLATFAEQLQHHSRTYPPVPEWGGFEGEALFTSAMQEIMRGDKTAEKAMNEVAATMNEAFEG